MPWEPGPGLGFTAEDVEPWLPFGDRTGLTVAEQRDDRTSVLSLTRSLIRLKQKDLTYRPLAGPPGTWLYRSAGLFVAANLSDVRQTVDMPAGTSLSSLTGTTHRSGGGSHPVEAWEALVCKVDEADGG